MSTTPRTMLISGVSSGIGLDAASYFLDQRWKVAGLVRPGTEMPEMLLNREGFTAISCDVADRTEVANAVAEAYATLGSIGVLVNNAGYGLAGPFEALSEEELHAQFETNFFGAARLARECIPLMKQQGGGTIIQLSSMFGRIGMPFLSAYGASKWALEGLSEALAQELEPHNIYVTLIEPGAIATDFFKNLVRAQHTLPESYPRYEPFLAAISKKGDAGDSPHVVSRAIHAAVNNPARFRRRPDRTAKLLVTMRRILPLRIFSRLITAAIG